MPAHLNANAPELQGVPWQKSRHSNSQGTCVVMAKLSDGRIAIRNSTAAGCPAIVFTSEEVSIYFRGVREGEFDHLLG